MNLYEATNGYVGVGVVRAVVLADNEEQALEVARKKFKETQTNGRSSYEDSWHENVVISLVAEDVKSGYCSEPNE